MEVAVGASDFIFAGNASRLEQWPEIARSAGILWCYNEQKLGDETAPCDHRSGCGITDDALFQKVLVIRDVTGFDADSYERLLLVTPAKKSLNANVTELRSLTSKFISAFGAGKVDVFESCKTTDGTVWIQW